MDDPAATAAREYCSSKALPRVLLRALLLLAILECTDRSRTWFWIGVPVTIQTGPIIVSANTALVCLVRGFRSAWA